MNPADFVAAPGRVVRHPRGYSAYIPDPLPPKDLPLSWELALRLSEADRAVSELAGVAATLPNPHLLIGPFVRKEAVLSSRIEGTQASLADLLRFEAGPNGSDALAGPDAGDVQEVANYVHALEQGLARLADLPVSLRLIREVHERLLRGVRGEHLTPGEFRRSQNWIGPPGCTLNDATFVPPPPEELTAAFGALEQFLHDVADTGHAEYPREARVMTTLPPLVRLALAHYQFEAIHPFLDGNGRVGRLLVTLLLSAWGVLPQPLLYLSAFFERNRPDYYRLLLGVSQRGEWAAWLDFFLRGVAEESKDAVRRSRRLAALWQEYREKLQGARAPGLPLRLLDRLMTYPATTLMRAAAELSVTPRTAQQVIDRLVAEEILIESTGRQRGRIYVAHAVLHAIER